MRSFLESLIATLTGNPVAGRSKVADLVPTSTIGYGFRNPFLTEREREKRSTRKLHEEVKALFDGSPFADESAAPRFYFDIVTEACERSQLTPSLLLGEALFAATRSLVAIEGTMYMFPEINWESELTLEEGVWLRGYLERKRRFLQEQQRLLPLWKEGIISIFAGILQSLPDSVTFNPDDNNEDDNESEDVVGNSLTVPLIDLCDYPAEIIERTMLTLAHEEFVLARIFEAVRDRADINLLDASGIPRDRPESSSRKCVFPTDRPKDSALSLVELYAAGTPFEGLLKTPLPFHIPLPVRYEHTHIVGGTGHGKTQLMQLLLHIDLQGALHENRSIIVIDSQGDLIDTIAHLPYFSKMTHESLADRLLIIDPNDIEHPVCLNMFDCNDERMGTLRPVDREKILNGTIDLYEYLFGAVLGAELTARQGMIFKYLARLMLQIPDATIHTLREIMESGERFRPFMEQLPPTARAFFETRFFDKNFKETKKQILNRLWGVLSNATFDRMFSHKRNKVDLFDAMQSGKIVLINTAKELLKQEGCSIFGRFFIALIAQAALQRTILAPHERHPAFVYIDEAHDYFDDNIDQLLIQARKYRIGLILAHQTLDQLSPSLRSSVITNTSTKFVGGVSAKDASTFGNEMRSNAEFIQSMKKMRDRTAFACYVRNLTPHAIQVTVPLGHLERLTRIEDWEHNINISAIREAYAGPPDAIWETTPPKQSESSERHVETRATKAVSEPPSRTPNADGQARVSVSESASAKQAPISAINHDQAPGETGSRRIETVPARPKTPSSPGRGGKQHKYLQEVIKQTAEECGYLATIEEPVLNGTGWVDVSLRRGDTRIACEISMTSTRDQELGNIEKCIAAGFTEIILVCPGERRRASLQKFIAARLEEEHIPRVRFLMPEELVSQLFDSVPIPEAKEETIRGYRVTATQKRLSEEESRARRDAIGRLIARSMRKAD